MSGPSRPPDVQDAADKAHAAPAPTPPLSVFSGKGLFTTSDPASAQNRGANWIAYQADPEGQLPGASTHDHAARYCIWMARPTQEMADYANEHKIPFIAQAENVDEINRALALDVTVPKGIIGNAGSWAPHDRVLAAERGWDLIQEWYWQAHPWEHAPDAANYPRFVNVCFGIYSEGELGGEGYVPQSKSVADYRAVWPGSFSIWKAESMTDADWAAFKAA